MSAVEVGDGRESIRIPNERGSEGDGRGLAGWSMGKRGARCTARRCSMDSFSHTSRATQSLEFLVTGASVGSLHPVLCLGARGGGGSHSGLRVWFAGCMSRPVTRSQEWIQFPRCPSMIRYSPPPPRGQQQLRFSLSPRRVFLEPRPTLESPRSTRPRTWWWPPTENVGRVSRSPLGSCSSPDPRTKGPKKALRR